MVEEFRGLVDKDGADEFFMVCTGPEVPRDKLEGSEFDDYTRFADYSVLDWLDESYDVEAWEGFESYLESNGFETGVWNIDLFHDNGEYKMMVSPDLGFSNDRAIMGRELSEMFKPVMSVDYADSGPVDHHFKVKCCIDLPVNRVDELAGELRREAANTVMEGLEEYIY